jgi:hypothetical protein
MKVARMGKNEQPKWRWEMNQDRNRRMYEYKQKHRCPNRVVAQVFGLSKAAVGYNLREYRKDLEHENRI